MDILIKEIVNPKMKISPIGHKRFKLVFKKMLKCKNVKKCFGGGGGGGGGFIT